MFDFNLQWKEFTTITIFGNPVPKSLTGGSGRIANTTKTKQAMSRRILFMRNHMSRNGLKMIAGQPIGVRVQYHHKRPNRLLKKHCDPNPILKDTIPDIDNLTKLLFDCGTKAGIWKDDGQIAYKEMIDCYVALEKKPRTIIMIMTVDLDKDLS